MSFVKKRIVLSGYYGFDNIGDEAILFSIISDLRKLNITPIVLSSNPKKTSEVFDVESVDRMNLLAVSKVIKSSDGLISGGGSLLQDVTSKKSPVYYLGVIKIAHFFKIPVYFYAQGVGPIKQKWLHPIIKNTVSKCKYISVRDEDSASFLKAIGIKNPINIDLDPVLINAFQTTPSSEPLPSYISDFIKSKPILFSLRKWHNSENLVNNVVDFIENMEGKHFLFLPFHFGEDSYLTNLIKHSLSKESLNRCLFIEEELSIEQTLDLFKHVSLTIGVRLHSLVFSATNNTPFIGISYDPKIESFLQLYDKKPIFSVDNWNNNKLITEVNSMFSTLSCKIKDIQKINDKLSESGNIGIKFL